MSTPLVFDPEARAAIIARGVQPPPFARLVPQVPNTSCLFYAVTCSELVLAMIDGAATMPASSNTLQTQPLVVAPAPAKPVNVEQGPNVNESQRNDDPLLNYIVTVSCLMTETTAARTRGRPPTTKKTQSTRMSKDIRVDTMGRFEIFNAALALHELNDQFKASKDHCPGFKMWFTGINGGKNTAPTISDDKDLALLVGQLAASKKKPDEITVFILFDVDDLDAYRVRKRVPRLGDMDINTVLHGDFVLKLKAQHKCEEHRGEHGEPGYCYVWPNGQHLGLNHRRLTMWAAAMAAGEATRHAPPNVPEFDGPQGSGTVTVKQRGRVTAVPAPAPAPVPSTSASDATSVLIAAMVPLLTSLTQSVVDQSTKASTATPDTPKVPNPPADPPANPPPPPVPTAAATQAHNGSCLGLPYVFSHNHTQDCVIAFKAESGIDVTEKLGALEHRDLTTDLLLEVPYDHLGGLLGLTEGKAIKFQIFCRHWVHNFKANILAEWEREDC
ncbi:hypothetical protein FRC09_014970 [Ceratobasidium sp. 395]|nr:hypothetical protein FRC09_014970 [Ceratobasidium sp. 395]